MSEAAVAVPKKKGRPVGRYSKDIVYTRFFAIMFWFQSMMFVYCCPTGRDKPTFVALEQVPYHQMATIGLMTWNDEAHAKLAMKQIPYFEMGGNPMDLEVVSNSNTHFAELVLQCEPRDDVYKPTPEEEV